MYLEPRTITPEVCGRFVSAALLLLEEASWHSFSVLGSGVLGNMTFHDILHRFAVSTCSTWWLPLHDFSTFGGLWEGVGKMLEDALILELSIV